MNLFWLQQTSAGNWLAQGTWTWQSSGWSAPAWRFTWVEPGSPQRSVPCAIGDVPPYEFYRAYLLENGTWRLLCESCNIPGWNCR